MAEEQKDKKSNSHSGGMGKRGVTRMASGYGDEDLSPQQRQKMQQMHHKQTLWIYWTLIILGFWMVLSPLTFSYAVGTVEPSGRELWLSLDARVTAMKWSDIISGILLVVFGWRTLTPNRPVSQWICCFIGIWISIAPMIFWAPTAAAYLNGMLVGVWVIALSILIPGLPNISRYIKKGAQFPEGWSYNPSSWSQRWILIVFGLLGWMAARYLGAYQLGYIDHVWDPFFGRGTMQLLDSGLSHAFPVSGAALGSFVYTIVFLLGFIGDSSRFRTMPWVVVLFGIVVIPLGLVSIFLVMAQSLVVGVWCTICLVTAILILLVIPLEIDEIIVAVYDLVRKKKSGESNMWEVFWKGSTTKDKTVDERSPDLINLPNNFTGVFSASLWGISFPGTLVISAALGIVLMFMPDWFSVGIETTTADICHLFGALIVITSIVSMAEVVRIVRFLNVLFGLFVTGSLWFTTQSAPRLFMIGLIIGVLVVGLSIPRGRKLEEFGAWEKYIR